jgi:dihydrofolate reductase
MAMKVVLFMSMTLNGVIAGPKNEEDFLSDENWNTFRRLAEDIGCFVVGRKTHDAVKTLYKDYNFDDVRADMIVVTRDPGFRPQGGQQVASSPEDAIRKASEMGRRRLLLTGGGELNGSFMELGLIDEVIVNVEPAVLGRGIRLFSEATFYRRLRLMETKKLRGGIVQLHYRVAR